MTAIISCKIKVTSLSLQCTIVLLEKIINRLKKMVFANVDNLLMFAFLVTQSL